ncbi:hypothetical protein Cni_G15327 [Canna indica]|uniref:Plastid movement impaired 2 n=1 Tax=Canna indica TaxID=4628 RepID=A0AAQ3KGT9_9LILI|nr:hypothetical protein Cni_G15327 [Canna indica]
MGNSLSGKKKIVKVMKVDGTTLKLKPPVQAASLLREHPGYTLLDAEDVKRLGVRAQPLDPDAPLKPGKLFFLVELPRVPTQRAPRRAWSGALQVGAKERLESLKLTRRSMSDLAITGRPSSVEAEETKDGALRLKMKLPKAQVERLMQESKDAAEAAQKIMQLCAATDHSAAATTPLSSPEPVTPTVRAGRKEKRTRFLAMPDEIIA